MNNTEILNRISSITENLDPTIFAELISTVQEQIKSEKQKQEIKVIIEDVALGLIRFFYDLEDEQLEFKFYDLMDDLVIMGVDIGKILIGEFRYVKNSEQQTKVIELLEKTLKSSSWIRKISFSQKLDPVIGMLLIQNTPIRIKEMLQKLRDQIKPYLRTKQTQTRPISLTLHADKTFIIQEWLKDPEIFIDGEAVSIQGVSMFEFLTREVNFEILLDYILFSHEHGARVLTGMTQLVPHFKKFKKFNPLKKTSECVLSALSSNNSEFTALQAMKLLKVIFNTQGSQVFGYFLVGSCVNIFLKNFGYPEVRPFFFVYLISNKNLSVESQEFMKNKILLDLFRKLAVMLTVEQVSEALPVAEFLGLMVPEILSEHSTAKADEFEAAEGLSLYKYRKVLLTVEGQSLICALFEVVFKEYWCSSNSEQQQDFQNKCGDIISVLIKAGQGCKPLKKILYRSITEEFLVKIQSNILHYSLNNSKQAFRLPHTLVTQPVGSHMIQLARLFTETLSFKPELTPKVSTNSWSSIFLWFFVFKRNGMILNLISSSLSLMLDHSEERILKEVLFDKKFLPRILDSLLSKPNPEDRDFLFFCKKLARKISEYTETKKNKLTKDILAQNKWKNLFPPVQEVVAKARPASRPGKQGHTFILGLDPLLKVQTKPQVKQEHEIEFLASQLDMIYKIQ